MFYIYAIYNKQYKKFYIGQTENLEQRLKMHNEKAFINSFTARFDGHWDLIYKEVVDNRKQALLREKQLKSYQGRKFIKNLIYSSVAQW